MGEEDPVTLSAIRQIGCDRIASAIYHIPVGKAWPCEAIKELKEKVSAAGLVLEVIESLPIHEDIKLHRGKFRIYRKLQGKYQKTGLAEESDVSAITLCRYLTGPVLAWITLSRRLRTLAYYKTDEKSDGSAKMVLPGLNTSISRKK